MPTTSLSQRHFHAELMDRPGLDLAEHRRALVGLGRLNAVSRACRRLWREIVTHTSVKRDGRLRVLDVASGGGDIALGLWRLARRHGVELRVLGLDVSPTACAHATERCRPAGRSIVFQQSDVTSDALPAGFDVVTCSLFLHHLAGEQATRMLRKMAAAGRVLVVSDLRRSAAGYALAQAACRVLTRSPIVRFDGPQSVANAFSVSEMRDLCAAASLQAATVRRAWPCRMIVVYKRSGSVA
jgi:2-polyprenyl-3-methyl-5-hydroxy-6-metoxy-1,4-benzoquinol methylase